MIGLFPFFPAQAANNPPPPVINNTPPPTATEGASYDFQFSASYGLAPFFWSATGLMSGVGVSLGGNLSGTPTSAGHFPFTVHMKDSLGRSAPSAPFTMRISVARPAATFSRTLGSMTVARSGHTATLLLGGKVLVAGGPDASAELYDPTTEMFTGTGSMSIARSGHTATLLANAALANFGKVLITGGAGTTLTAELYDPKSGMFEATGSMRATRNRQTATLLNTGQVLVAGGGTASAELFNPATGTFKETGSMTVPRTEHTATLLPDGMVLIAGGGTASAELYDPASGEFTATGSLSEWRSGHTATLLTDGTVLIAGPVVTAELYKPSTGAFSSVGNLLTTSLGSTATLRKNGTVLVAGGRFAYFNLWLSQARAQLFAPESEGFTTTGSLLTARDGHTATELTDGSVLVTGGVNRRLGYVGNRGYEIRRRLFSAELFK